MKNITIENTSHKQIMVCIMYRDGFKVVDSRHNTLEEAKARAEELAKAYRLKILCRV